MLWEAKMVIRLVLAAAAVSSREEGGDLAATETSLLTHRHSISCRCV